MPRRAATVTLEDIDVECTQCGVRMTTSVGGGGTIRYFRCPKCQRWASSMYTEVFGVDAKIRMRPQAAHSVPTPPPASVKERLERWLRGINPTDPYGELGASPADTDTEIREQYLAQARLKHPDHGGDAEGMQRLNQAYERIQLQRAQAASLAPAEFGLAS